MHIYPVNKKKSVMRFLLPLLLAAAVLSIFIYGFRNTSQEAGDKEKEVLENAINNAIINCYAIEGAYPESIEYLENHYGIIINKKKFEVCYVPQFAANLRPEIRVILVGSENMEGVGD